MSIAREIMKKIAYLLIIAALVVAFAFALVACNDNGSTDNSGNDNTMSDADYAAVKAAVEASSQKTSYGATVTEVADGVTTETNANFYNTGRNRLIQTEYVSENADGSVAEKGFTVYIPGESNIFAEAVYEGESTLPSYSNFDNASGMILQEALTDSGLLSRDKVNDLFNKNNSFALTDGTKSSADGTTVYVFKFDNGEESGKATITVDGNGVLTAMELAYDDGSVLKAKYVYDLGAVPADVPTTSQAWYTAHPKAEQTA